MSNLKGKTIFITGGTRGIGQAIAFRAALDGANIVIAAKTTEPHPKLPSTIYSTAAEIEKLGGQALPLVVDVRFEEQVHDAMRKTEEKFGGLDILINNASAINLSNTEKTPLKRYDLMQAVNTRGTFVCSQAALPLLKKSANPHILTMSPPLNLNPQWFKPFVAYTISKYGMSMCTLGMAEEFREFGIAVNSLWPRTLIGTSALQMIDGIDYKRSRSPEIVADAGYWILIQNAKNASGNFYLDEDVLRKIGITDFSKYALDPDLPPDGDLFVEEH